MKTIKILIVVVTVSLIFVLTKKDDKIIISDYAKNKIQPLIQNGDRYDTTSVLDRFNREMKLQEGSVNMLLFRYASYSLIKQEYEILEKELNTYIEKGLKITYINSNKDDDIKYYQNSDINIYFDKDNIIMDKYRINNQSYVVITNKENEIVFHAFNLPMSEGLKNLFEVNIQYYF